MDVWAVHHIQGRMNDREKDRRETPLVGSGSGEDGIDERLKLSGDGIIEFLNKSSPSENKKTNSFFAKAYRTERLDALSSDCTTSTFQPVPIHGTVAQQWVSPAQLPHLCPIVQGE
jgi:hypothetical protein